MKITPMFGNGIASKSLPVTAQRRLNCYFENRPDGDKTSVAVFGTPGLVKKATLAATVRGLYGRQSTLYAVASNQLYSLDTAFNITSLGTVSTTTGSVGIASNPSQLIVVSGTYGYLYNYSTGAFTQITSAGFPNGAQTVTFVGGYFVCEQPGTQYFWVSDLFDGSTWNALSFASASQSSDLIKAVDSLIGNLVLFSERHTEFWQNVGATPEPFQPIISATSEVGLAAVFSRAHVNQTICFLGMNPQGAPQVAQIQGYNITIISTTDLDDIMANMSTVSDAVGLSYVVDGHPMYQLTFPTADRSFLYDTSTGIWSEVQSGVTAQYSTRHYAQYGTYFNSRAVVSDYRNGNLYWFDTNSYDDNGSVILREVITRHGSIDFNVFTVDEIYLDMETGVGLKTGQGSSPIITMEVSKDNGATWSTPRQLSVGALGNYHNRVVARRFGSSRDFVFRFRMTDPVKFVITNGAVSVRQTPQ